MMTRYGQVLENTIFPSFIRSCVPEVNLNNIIRECYQIQNNVPKSENCSNEGGYQSPGVFTRSGYSLGQLYDIVKEFAQDTIDEHELKVNVERLYWWFNINKHSNYNVLHNHHRADLFAIFYPSVPENSGKLCLVRNDGSQYGNLYSNVFGMLELELKPESGRLYLFPGHLWHYVTASQAIEDRISISFNLYLK